MTNTNNEVKRSAQFKDVKSNIDAVAEFLQTVSESSAPQYKSAVRRYLEFTGDVDVLENIYVSINNLDWYLESGNFKNEKTKTNQMRYVRSFLMNVIKNNLDTIEIKKELVLFLL